MKKRVFAMLLAFVFVLQMGCLTAFAQITITVKSNANGNIISVEADELVPGEDYSVRAYFTPGNPKDYDAEDFADITTMDTVEGIDNLDQFTADDNGQIEWVFPSRLDEWVEKSWVTAFVNGEWKSVPLSVPNFEDKIFAVYGEIVLADADLGPYIWFQVSNFDRTTDGGMKIEFKMNGEIFYSAPIADDRVTTVPLGVAALYGDLELRVYKDNGESLLLDQKYNEPIPECGDPVPASAITFNPRVLSPKAGTTASIAATVAGNYGILYFEWDTSDYLTLDFTKIDTVGATSTATFKALRAGTANVIVTVNFGEVKIISAKIAP